MSRAQGMDRWWKADKGKAHDSTWQAAKKIESQQSDLFDRFVKLEALYDPNSPDADGSDMAHVTENAIASNVDTVASSVGTTEIRARFMTDGGDWQQQRTARRLEWYSEEQVAALDVLPRCRSAFKECAKKGNGLVKVSERFGRPYVEHVMVENVIVDQDETRDGRRPRQLHQWDMVDADELEALHPKFATQIETARGSRTARRSSSGRSPTSASNLVQVLHSWRLPVGVKGQPGYKPGRYVKAISECDLVDEKWEEDFFPFAEMTWTERAKSWYGISGAERIAGIQRALNKRNWQIERVLDQNANLTTYVRPADANLTVKTSRVGNIGVVKGDWPHTPNPPLVSAETYQSRLDLRESAQNEFGQTSMAVHGAKPAGLDSGAALREFKDQTTTRYASQEEDFERLVLKTITLVLWVCKKLGAKAPVMVRRSRFGARKLKWSDVDMKDVKVQIKAASTLNRTPAGRMQMVIEYAQAGIVTTDQARRLMGHPDIESEMSLYNAALESIEHDLDTLADGKVVQPEPYSNHEMCVWRAQREYLKWRDDGAPEEILEGLRQYIVTAAWYIDKKTAPAANTNAALANPGAPAMPMDPAMGGAPPMADPAMTQPAAALAAQAMQLRAS